MARGQSIVAVGGAVFATLGCAGSPPSFPESGTEGTGSSTAAASNDDPATSAPPAADTTTAGDSSGEGGAASTSTTRATGDGSTGEPAATETSATGGSETGGACGRVHTIEMLADDAVLSGAWMLTQSMIGEGTVIAAVGDGSAVFGTDLPCPATWHVWVRMRDAGLSDSLNVQVDGVPPGEQDAIFEVDCTSQPADPIYSWKELNYREESAAACEYLYDPWTFDTGPGPIELAFFPREDGAISRVIFTSDPMFEPPP